MSKYNIEGGLDFFAELYKSLDIEESEEKTEEDDNKCLITNQELIDKYVKMACGHKFNYIPLYNDIVNHKNKFNNLEGTHSKLNINEIRCPYCRKKQQELLPYYEELGLAKLQGVNFYNFNLYKCEYKIPNPDHDSNMPKTDSNSEYKSCLCYGTKIKIHDWKHANTYGDTKYYCYTHKKEMIKKYKLQQKEKAKEEKQKAKAKEKEEKQKAKAKEKEEKQNAKAKENEKQQQLKNLKKNLLSQIKVAKKDLESENVVLGPLNVVNQTECVHVLKAGKNKGKQCGCKIVAGNMCKRHYLMNKKDLIINN